MAVTITLQRSRQPVIFNLSGESQMEYSPGGADKQVQFNDVGEMAGDTGLTFDKTLDTLKIGGKITIGSAADPTATLDLAASSATKAHIRLRAGVAPTGTDLTDGCIWYDGTDLKIRVGTTTKTATLV